MGILALGGFRFHLGQHFVAWRKQRVQVVIHDGSVT